MRRIIIIALALSVLCFHLRAQEDGIPVLPNDPRIITDVLPNGLTYYIARDKQADTLAGFYLVQKTGYLTEAPNEKGFSEIIARLAMKGTRNFPDRTMSRYLKAQGIRAGKSASVKVNPDYTLFSLENVPVTRPSAIDTTLLILYDWACFINLDDEDIELDDMKSSDKARLSTMKNMIDDNEFYSAIDTSSGNGIIGLIGDPVKSKSVRNFYYKWFRPDMQAVIIVGNVDSATVVSQIRSLFSSIPKPRYEEQFKYYTDDNVNSVNVNILSNAGIEKPEISLSFVIRDITEEEKASAVSYLQEYMLETTMDMFVKRLQESALFQDFPIYGIEMRYKRMLKGEGYYIASIEANIDPSRISESVNFLAMELKRMQQYGFTEGEYALASDHYSQMLKHKYTDRKKFGGFGFRDMLLHNFLYGRNLSSIEMEYTMMGSIIPEITYNDLNGFAKELFNLEDCNITVKLPENGQASQNLQAENIRKAYSEGIATDMFSYLDKEIAAPVFNAPKQEAGAKNIITFESVEPVTGATLMKLSNGAIVMINQTQLSDYAVSFRAVKKGGASAWTGNYSTYKILGETANLDGLSNLSRINLDRYLESEGMTLQTRITPNLSILEGSAPLSSLEDYMKLINLSFTSRRVDESAFREYVMIKKAELLNSRNTAAKILADKVREATYSNSPLVAPVTEEDTEMFNYPMIVDFINREFSGAEGYIFLFSGNINEAEFKPLIAKYIGSLPKGNATQGWIQKPIYFNKTDHFEKLPSPDGMPNAVIDFSLLRNLEYNTENILYAEMTTLLLEDMLGGNRVKARFETYPESALLLNFRINTDKKNCEKMKNAILARIERIAVHGIREYEFNSIRSHILIEDNIRRCSDKYWIDVLTERYINGTDINTKRKELLESMTPEKLQNFLLDIYTNGNKIIIAL